MAYDFLPAHLAPMYKIVKSLAVSGPLYPVLLGGNSSEEPVEGVVVVHHRVPPEPEGQHYAPREAPQGVLEGAHATGQPPQGEEEGAQRAGAHYHGGNHDAALPEVVLVAHVRDSFVGGQEARVLGDEVLLLPVGAKLAGQDVEQPVVSTELAQPLKHLPLLGGQPREVHGQELLLGEVAGLLGHLPDLLPEFLLEAEV